VRPLTDKIDLPARDAPELMEGGRSDDAIGLLCRAAAKKGDSVLCTHGDVVPDLLRRLAAEGMALPDQVRWPKGSTWVLDWDGDRVTAAHFLPPPA
jgi:8-oxo-dGTP diphosphatase